MPKTFEHDLDLVGIKFRMDKDKRAALACNCPTSLVRLVREQENKYDENAIRVELTHRGSTEAQHLGYIRADSAAILAPYMDRGELVFKSAKLNTLMDGNNGPNSEGRLTVVFTDKRPAK